jgi:hypothetical protein
LGFLPILIPSVSKESLKTGRALNYVEKKSQFRSLYQAELSFIIYGEIKTFLDKQKLNLYPVNLCCRTYLKESYVQREIHAK